MVELLVTMAILVIAFGLVTYLYTRAARIRRIVVVNSEVQQALSQMMDTLTHGEKNSWGLIDADKIDGSTHYDTEFTALKGTADKMKVEISEDKEIHTLKITRNVGNPLFVDVNRKITLLTEEPQRSKFQYFDSGKELKPSDDLSKTTFIKITLWARSTNPAFKNAPAVPLMTGVRLNNKPLEPPTP